MTYNDDTPKLSAARARRFADTRRLLEAEQKLAPPVVEQLLEGTPRETWSALATHPGLQSYGAITHLGDVFSRALLKDPEYAGAVAELAVQIVESLPVDMPYPRMTLAQMKAHAWKDLGKYLRFMGKHKEAVEVLREAEKKLGVRTTLAHDLAIIRVCLAATLQELEQFDESLTLLAECKSVFREHGDTRNMTVAAFTHGVLLQRMKLFREAREAYLLIAATTPDLDDEQLAAINNTIGLCSIELEEYGAAHDAFSYAQTLFSELDQPLSVLNVETGRGRLLVRAGHYAVGVAHLRPIRRAFLTHGLHEEAGLAGLEIVEGLLGMKNDSAAETLARKIVREFELAGLNKRAIAALNFLTEILENKTASAKAVRDIRDYIISLRTNPERDFGLIA